jgi:hypothetical protein
MEQVAIGVGVTLLCILVSGLGFWVAEALVLAVVLAGVAIWAGALLWFRIFGDFDEAFYFALVSYTTVGYGELLPPADWRMLGAMAAANGFINIGLLTTLLLEGLGHVRAGYHRTVHGEDLD